jgi:hypothetical protein
MIAAGDNTYWQSTRHPWPCLLFLLPLLAVYEGGIFYLGGAECEALRTGSDTWLRATLQWFGFQALFWLPGIILAIFIGWNWWRWQTRPKEVMSVWVGMTVESVLFAMLLWCLGRFQDPALEQLGMRLHAAAVSHGEMASAVSYLGAGIYEEFLFRLLLFPILLYAITLTGAPRGLTVLLAMLLSATIFAAAHHIGPYGEAYDAHVFLFRFLAGLYFVILFQFRGIGIAIGAHACYDVLVGVAMA